MSFLAENPDWTGKNYYQKSGRKEESEQRQCQPCPDKAGDNFNEEYSETCRI